MENQKKFIIKKEVIEGYCDEFVPNNDCFDDTKYCVC